MIRRLHLVDVACPAAGWPLLGALTSAGEPVALLGPRSAAARARETIRGLRCVCSASAPGWSDRSQALALRRSLDAVQMGDLSVIAWSDRAQRVARHPLAKIAYSHRAPDQLCAPPPLPGADRVFGSVTRAELGVGEHETLLVALGGPSGSVDAFSFAYFAGVLSLAGIPVVTVVPPHAVALDRALRFVERHNHAWRSIVADYRLPEVLGAADLCAYLPPARTDSLARRSAASLRSEIAWAQTSGLAAVVREEPMMTRALEQIANDCPHPERLLRTPSGEPGLKTIRMVERAIALGRAEPTDRVEAFETWASAVRSIGEARPAGEAA